MHEWILDNGCTPYLVLDATVDGIFVPEEHVKEGQIVLNISPSAVRDLQIEQDFLSFVPAVPQSRCQFHNQRQNLENTPEFF